MGNNFSRERDIDALYRLWNYYRSMGMTYKDDWLAMGVPQSLGYLQRRLSVSAEDMNDRAIEVTGLSLWGMDNINPEKLGQG